MKKPQHNINEIVLGVSEVSCEPDVKPFLVDDSLKICQLQFQKGETENQDTFGAKWPKIRWKEKFWNVSVSVSNHLKSCNFFTGKKTFYDSK